MLEIVTLAAVILDLLVFNFAWIGGTPSSMHLEQMF